MTEGDASQELIQSNGGTCVNGRHTNLGPGGPTISNFFPYTCVENFYGAPSYPGLRSSAIQVRGANSTILASTPVYQTVFPEQKLLTRSTPGRPSPVYKILRLSRYPAWIIRSTSPTPTPAQSIRRQVWGEAH